jgi:histidine triad (HIT) family protein
MMVQREPMDLAAYVRRSTRGPCFVCALVAGDPDNKHEIVYEDEAHIAFLSRYPTQLGPRSRPVSWSGRARQRSRSCPG